MAKKKIKKAKQVVKPPSVNDISSEIIAAAYSAVNQPVIPVFLKVCRLCESKDGPFLNIFDVEKVIAKKIDELMPFSVTENDDLPHKICFRCSAKLEELYEFIQKCIKTQENLHNVIGKNAPIISKTKMGKKLWEEKLNKTNMSNDDICDALIKKAMEGIKGISSQPLLEEETPSESRRVTRSKDTSVKKEVIAEPEDHDEGRQVKLEKCDSKSNKATRSKTEPKKVEPTKKTDMTQSKKPEAPIKSVAETSPSSTPQLSSVTENEKKASETKIKNSFINKLTFDYEEPTPTEPPESESKEQKKEEPEEPKKPFNIMDHIIKIKVNGVGILFQCKLCNRNFLKKEVVESHSCAKHGRPKADIPKSIPAPEPPKVSTVKYIKIDDDMKKSLVEKVKKSENDKKYMENNVAQEENDEPPPPKVKPKPKAGPASKTKRGIADSDSRTSQGSNESSNTEPSAPTAPSVQFPSMPNLNGRFKLVPGPNNMFTLVEDSPVHTSLQTTVNSVTPPEEPKKYGKKRKSDEFVNSLEVKSKERTRVQVNNLDVIDLDNQSQPYPVGLFQTVAHNSRIFEPPVSAAPVTFTTPAMKKQSYTIVQTGNPSKLLISTKAKAIEMEVPKKRPRKSKPEVREVPTVKDPYTVTLEDVAPPKDTGFFTFINVDPLLQPSYVLPTDNIIQESQISTSSSVLPRQTETKDSKDKEKYTCNMCGESFSREKKLLSHIQSHYAKMDEEDQLMAERIGKKKGKK